MNDINQIKFSCEVCKTERPFKEIEVLIQRFYFTIGGSVDRNVRYCIDKPECFKGAGEIAKKFADDFEGSDIIIPLNYCPAGFADIVEGPETFKAVSDELKRAKSCLLGWNDQEFTHYDVLFTLQPRHFGNIQGGIRPEQYLFVSIMRVGAFAFNLNREAPLQPEYIDTKLGAAINGLGTPVKEKLALLINGVMTELNK